MLLGGDFLYNVISEIIDHVYESQYVGDQQYIYYICGALIIILTVVTIDLIYRVFSHFWRGGK